ncbi:MAG: MarR family winged helix-turn-helix transcriptional regulator [Caldimonas sp.]
MSASPSIPVRDSLDRGGEAFRTLPSFRVHLLAGMSARHAELRFVKQFGLRLLECRIVGMVGTLGALSLKQICSETDIEKAHASRLVDRLQQRGLVEKFESSHDLRSISVELTAAGRKLHKALYADAVERNEAWLSVLSADERRRFVGIVDKLIERSRAMLAASPADAGAKPRAARADDAAATAAAPGHNRPAVLLDGELARNLHLALGAALSGAIDGTRGRSDGTRR